MLFRDINIVSMLIIIIAQHMQVLLIFHLAYFLFFFLLFCVQVKVSFELVVFR